MRSGIALLAAQTVLPCLCLALPTGSPEFTVQAPRGNGTPIIRASDYGFSETNDFNAAAINRALAVCREKGARTLELDPGTYRCFDAPHGIAVTNFTDLTFDGRGAVLVFRRPAEFRCQPQSELVHENANLLVKDCERVKVCDFKMDWDWDVDPLGFFCVCKAVHVDEDNPNASYVDLMLTDFERYPKYPEPVPVKKIQVMDPSHLRFAPGESWQFGLSEGHWGAKNEWIAPNVLRVYPAVKDLERNYNPRMDVHFSPSLNVSDTRRFKIGQTYRLQHQYYGKNGINLVSSRHVTLQDVDIWSCFGMGIVIDGKQKYTQIENVRIAPRPDSPYRRPYSTVSDGLHVARSSGYLKLLNCTVRLNNDDAINIHDRFTVASRKDARTLTIVNERGIGYFRPDIGDPMELRHPDWRPTGFSATLVGTCGNDLLLDRDIPSGIGDNFFVFDRAYGTDNVIVRNCVFEDSAHRNLFSPSNLTIEDCTFRRTGGRSLWILADARKRLWCEGLGETNIVIRGNLFDECCHIDRTMPVISTSFVSVTPWKADSLDPDFIRDILIEENVFVNPYGAAFVATAGSDITFRNNEIRFTRAPFSSESGRAYSAGARGVDIDRNSWITNLPPKTVVSDASHDVTTVVLGTYPVRGDASYTVSGGYVAERFMEGAVMAMSAEELDATGRVLAFHGSSPWAQLVCATGYPHPIRMPVKTAKGAVSLRVRIHASGNPVTFTPMPVFVRPASKAPPYRGIYDKEDPLPADRAAALAELAKIPPATAAIERCSGRNVAIVDGEPMPLNEYKGFTDYRLMGECGGNVVMTFNRGSRLFLNVSFDKAVRNAETGEWDFSRIEDTLLRIHRANPKARVILGIDLDPDNAFLERHPESIFVNEKGVRGRVNFQAFAGFDSSPLDPGKVNQRWAFSYTSEEWQALVDDGLRRLCDYLKTTPASNIVIGFHLAGGMDGQFVQWQYGPENGHFDYSESNRKALCRYLMELYGSDEALRKAWGDANVTLDTARNPSVAEFRSTGVFDDRPGLGRKLADCRRFVSVGPARALNRFAKTLRRNFGRPCLVDTWYTSTIWSQPGRLALDELVKDDGVNVIVTVSGYSYKRALDGMGASANNAIAGLNLRGLLYVQEMDHRSWRTERPGGFMSSDSIAIPDDERDFGNQIRRDGASVIAAGGAGFHLFDMFGSWYHGSKVKDAIREIFALNAFATCHAGKYAAPRIGIFADEKSRLLRETTFDNIDIVWRTSGVMPVIHYLTDIENPDLPEYDLYVAYHPVTVTASQVDAFRRRAAKRGKVLAIIGEAGCASRDFTDASEALAQLGMRVEAHPLMHAAEGVVVEAGDPLTDGLAGCGELGNGVHVAQGRAVPRTQIGYATIEDPEAKPLGRWSVGGGVAFARKPLGDGTLVFMARDGGLTPRLLHNLAKEAGVQPFAEPGNATYVGNGVACVHRLDGPAVVDFGRPVRLVDVVGGNVSEPTRFWRPELSVGESAAVGYLP